ncbi:uncharacterized protein MELLADRAFT_87867 [Melampsora larici-populina 98AG31]|uniref:Uncharacterized protein n=1 Tax=Melampsora larici-populina (strain 98AG31 / pathotype 3-4-7) TaxID=747676 RepID=F4RPT6_MELLP|nr:uncharacterized protein MELLADRAFT_87867 [Melampsora larici-populina 98AG31]EGG05682.1 hypothetical protein MELLADRAFT_87867 [Melampsora larici-populina 98AG31]
MSKASKAVRGQRKQWRNLRKAKAVPISELEDELTPVDLIITFNQNPPHADSETITPSNPVIMISSDCNSHDAEDLQTPQPPQSVILQPSEFYWMPIDPNYLTEEDDMDPLGMPLYAQPDIVDSSDDEACNHELVNEAIFQVFTQPFINQQPLGKRKTKSGQILKGYKRPRVQLNSNKLAPQKIPKETQRRQRIEQEKALGKSKFSMADWVIKKPPSAPAPVSPPSPPDIEPDSSEIESY